MEIKIKDSNTTMCPNCGKELESDCKFCKNCGTKIDIAEDKNVEETIGIITEENSEQSKTNEHMHKSLKSKKKFAFILFGILALIIVVFLIFSNNNKNNKLLSNNEIAIRTSPDKYTWYIKNYVGKNCASFGYTSLGGDKRDRYGDATVLLVLIADDGSFVDPEDEEMLKQYTVTGQNINPNTELKLVFQKDSSGKETNLLESQNIEEIELKVKKLSGTKSKKVSDSSSDSTSDDSKSTDKSIETDANTNKTKYEENEFAQGAYQCKYLSNGTVELLKYTGEAKSVDIPSKIGGKEVSSIGSKAFKDCTFLDEVDIPSSVINIGNSAFEGCTNLTEVYIWGDIKTFGDCSFKNCSSLYEVDIPSSTISIGNSAFENCTGVEDIYFWGGKTIGKYAFKNCSSLKSLDIYDDTESIGDYAFYGCINLSDVTIWNDDTTIGTEAFGNCPKATINVI